VPEEAGPVEKGAMKKNIFCGALAIVMASGWISWAASVETVVVLRSGEVIRGVVVREGPAYKVRSEILGNLEVQAADVISVHEATAPAEELKKRQEELMSDPDTMSSIQDLAQDKEIVALVMDPDMLDAIKRHDIEALQKNPKFIEFAKHPEIQKLVQESMAKQTEQKE